MGTVIDAADLLDVVGKIIREKVDQLNAKMEAMQLQPGPPGDAGKDADADEIARRIKADEIFVGMLQGRPGVPGTGIKAVEVNPDNTAFDVVLDNGERTTIALPPGSQGKDADPVAVAQVLIDNKTFVESLRGRQGEPGMGIKAVEVEPDQSAFHLIFDNDESVEIKLPKGADGKSVDVGEVVTGLRHDEQFQKACKGEPGVGIEHAKLNPDTNVFSIVYTNGHQHDFAIPKAKDGKPGKDAHPKDSADYLKADTHFLKLVKGDPGKDGKPGKDGPPGPPGPVGDGIVNKQWMPDTVYRMDERVTHNLGQVYKALADTVEEPGYSLQWQRIGTLGFRFLKRKPAVETDLADGDIYPDGGSLFLMSNGKAHLFLKRPRDADNLGIAKHLIESHDFGKALVEALTQCEQFTGIVAAKAPGPEVTNFYLKDLKNLVIEFKNAAPAVADVSALTLELIRIFKMDQAPPDEYATPVRWFRGRYSAQLDYSVGDVVKDGRKTYIAVEQPIRGQLAKPQWAEFSGGSSSAGAVSNNAITVAVDKVIQKRGILAWDADYTPGDAVDKNTVVNDSGWLMVANKDTTDRAAPQTIGDASVYGTALPDDDTGWTSKTTEPLRFLWVGTQYTLGFHYIISHIVFYIAEVSPDISYDVFIVDMTGGKNKYIPVSTNYPAQTTGWHTIPTGQIVVPANSTLSIILQKTSLVSSSTVTGDWNYVRQSAAPTAGQASQSNNNVGQLHINQKDATGTDRATLLDAVVPGSNISAGNVIWEVTGASFAPGSNNDGVYTFTVNPHIRLESGNQYTFTFEVFGTYNLPIWMVPDFYLPDPQVQGLIKKDGAAIEYNENGYTVDILYQQVVVSDDWDIMSASDTVAQNSYAQQLPMPAGTQPVAMASPATYAATAASKNAVVPIDNKQPGDNVLGDMFLIPNRDQFTVAIHCWNPDQDFHPVMEVYQADKTTPVFHNAAQVIAMGATNYTKKKVLDWNRINMMLAGTPYLFLTYDTVKANAMVLTQMDFDLRNPDMAVIKITCSYTNDKDEYTTCFCDVWVKKQDMGAWFQFSQVQGEHGTQWRVFLS